MQWFFVIREGVSLYEPLKMKESFHAKKIFIIAAVCFSLAWVASAAIAGR